MFPQPIRNHIESIHKNSIHQIASVSGGSINEALRYRVGDQEFFVKYNSEVEGIIEKEVDGLNAIAQLNCIATPEVMAFEKIDGYELLILPFIRDGVKSSEAWETFGRQLAIMHKNPAPYFGWKRPNFLGSLPQSNHKTSSFIEFFINERLKPQIELAKKNQYLTIRDLGQFEKLFLKLNEIVPDEEPSLVHGDLWSGNFMIDEHEKPYLIDPSIHYNHRETDIAFTYLFGSFAPRFYDAYHHYFALAPDFDDRIALYNIYPLLVHLNLFGSSYYSSVSHNLKSYL